MAYSVSALTDYVNQIQNDLIFQTITGSVTAKMMTLQTGVKSSETINIVALTGVWQDGTTCGFTASGDTTFSQRTITIGKIKVNLDWCENALEPKYLQAKMAAGSNYEELTFEKQFVASLQNTDANKVEGAIWNGDTASLDQYLNKFDGLRKIIGAAAGVVACSSSGVTAWTEANARTVSKSLATAVAANASTVLMLSDPDAKAFIGDAELVTLRQKYMTDNLYNQNMNGEGQIMVEGTQIPYVNVPGLSGKKEIYIMRTSNMFLGTDLENEYEKYLLFYNTNSRKIEYEKHFKLGTQIAFPNEIVKYISA